MIKNKGIISLIVLLVGVVGTLLLGSLINSPGNLVGGGSGTINSLPVRNFLGLTDTPNSYSGQSGKVVAVNGAENALEFITGGGGGSWGSITGTLSDQTDLQTALDTKQDDISLTTTGSSGASTFIANTLNIPNYTLAGLGGANTALSNLSSVAINSSLLFDTDATYDIGSSSVGINDLHLGSGGIINWDGGDLLLTHSSGALALTGGNMNVAGVLSADTVGYNSLRAVFGERRIYINELTDALWRANRRFTVTQSGAGVLASLFDGDYESNLTVPVSTTNVINIYVENQSGVPVNGFTYPEGKIYVHFYYTNNNYSAISMRAKQNGVWYSLGTPADISTVSGDKVLEFPVSGQNYLTDIELTVTTNGTDQVLITAINYVMDRWTSQAEVPYFDKFSAINNILGNVNFRTVAQTTSANINADGDWYMGVGGTGGHFGIGTSTPGTYHLNVAGNVLGNNITTNSGYVFASLGTAYLRAGGTNAILIGDSAVQDIGLALGGGKVGINQQYPSYKLQIDAASATASSTVVAISGSDTGFSGANDAGTAYALAFTGTSYQTSIAQKVGAKIEMAKENTWNYADTPTGINGSLNFYTSSGTPNSPVLTKYLTLNSTGQLITYTGIVPDANDGAYLGTSALGFSDLFLAEGAVINFDNSDLTLTQAGNGLTIAGGDFILSENTSIALDPAGSADGKYSGTTIAGTAGYTQAFGDLVYLDPTDSRWEAVDANSASGADGDARGILGMVVSAGTDGTGCVILLSGVIRADANFATFTINNPIYVSETAGDITQTQPTTTDVVIRIIGSALTADEIYFNPDNVWATHI